MEPRHFWRRLSALLIDTLILSQLAFYLMLPFADGNTVRLSGGVYTSVTCTTVPLSAESQTYFAGRGINADNASKCVAYQNGFYAGSTLLVSSLTNDQGAIAENARTITVPINALGQEVSPVYPVSILAPVLVVLGIILMTWKWQGQTIGKNLARVQVVSKNGEYLSLPLVARRELLKFSPSIVLFAIGIFMPEYALAQVVPNLQNGENIALVLGFLGVSTFAYILWWVAPMIWWNGTMPYDRINGSMVERYYG